METGMIIIAAALFAAVLVPTLLIVQNTKQKSKTLFNGLKTIVAQNNGVLTEYIKQGNFALGIDNSSKTIYFFKKTEDAETSQFIDLSQITTCEISTKTRRIKQEKGFEELVEKITLVFHSKNNSELKQLALYNEEDTLLTDEITIAKNWKNKVHNLLTEKTMATQQKDEQKVSRVVA
jgi:hypothetical protein